MHKSLMGSLVRFSDTDGDTIEYARLVGGGVYQRVDSSHVPKFPRALVASELNGSTVGPYAVAVQGDSARITDGPRCATYRRRSDIWIKVSETCFE